MMKTLLKFIVLLSLIVPQQSWACVCKKVSDFHTYKNSKIVMLVKIKETKLVDNKDDFDVVHAKFDVVEIFKGKPGETDIIESSSGTSCATPLIAGEIYLIYSNGEKVKYISSCSKSRWINETKEYQLLEMYRAKN